MKQPDLMSENPIIELVESLHTAMAVLGDIGLADGDAAFVFEELDKLRERARQIRDGCHANLTTKLGKRSKMLVTDTAGNTYMVEKSLGAPRWKEVDRVGLVGLVMRMAPTIHKANPTTGEVLHPAEAQVMGLKEAFNPEPRWGVLDKVYGLKPKHRDEYATKTQTETMNVERMEDDDG